MRTPSIGAVTILATSLSGCAGDPDPGAGASALEPAGEMTVIFSPQPPEESHNARVAQIIDGAARSIDVAMYSFSDPDILRALGDAVSRGVRVRFLLDDASADRRLQGDALLASRSGQLEQRGINVRHVNRILHHKLMIVDGPRDDLEAAHTATVVTGSANWSRAAATIYDENTLFSRGHAELALRLQAEMDLLWQHSRDVVVDGSLPFELSSAAIDDAAIPDDPGIDALFTSDNFTVSGDTFTAAGTSVVADELVRAIEAARESIHVASGHLRSRPVADALMAKKASDPGVDIRVYLDGQEHISAGRHARQVRERSRCLESAGSSEADIRACTDRGFLYGHEVGLHGIDVRYKHYAYRWHISYAKQMHHKYLIIDGLLLYTGTYNLSDNAERNTFENMLVIEASAFPELVLRYRENFARIWETGRAEGRRDRLSQAVRDAETIPLVFEPMALSWEEITTLKALIRENCPAVDSAAYRADPAGHRTCERAHVPGHLRAHAPPR